MKRISAIGLLLILCSLTSMAQTEIPGRTNTRQSQAERSDSLRKFKNINSTQSLERASIQELNQYLRKAKNKKNKGLGLVVLGSAACVVGAILVDRYSGDNNYSESNDTYFNDGVTLCCIGLATTAVGIPALVTGTVRAGKIKKAMNDRTGAGLNLAPCLVYSDNNRNLIPGFVFRVRF